MEIEKGKPNVGTIGRISMWKENISGRQIGVPKEFKPTRLKWCVDRAYEIIYSYPGAFGMKPDLSKPRKKSK